MNDWSADELWHTVAAYLDMLTLELSGQKYNKAAINRELVERLNGRSRQAVEFKHCNISAVLLYLGYPTISGYKPRRNFQLALVQEIIHQIEANPVVDRAALQAVEQIAVVPQMSSFAGVHTSVPRAEHSLVSERPGTYLKKRDYLAIEARNRSLGLAGEEFILRYEEWRLREAGKRHLAEKIEHISVDKGDGAGYDILSFESSGEPKYIEVKTTAYSERTPFWISSHEVRFSENNEIKYKLARVYDFRRKPRFFTLSGSVHRHCELDPTTYIALLR